ncbi:Futalosine hydrolase [Paractinoplanes deccanensis]|uniref:Futalosine hydrolase n=1 Tax=Paractinoplanes deccanensis TaxID=113561 RepID=A0ABQ3YCX4_9ACTN|nr:futalosine hydrolase [Actinoplanes deccanensis]GID77871.1 Futalosine hydrolase [Actinoplanes deccanensis]
MPYPLLVVTAVPAEAEAIRAGLAAAAPPSTDPAHVVVEPIGVGPAAAAATTARLLTTTRYRAVISAGIAGGFPGRAPLGATVLATSSICADLGAESPEGFLPIDELGFGTSRLPADPLLFKALTSALPQAIAGDILTLSTVTGTAETADRLAARFPDAVAEAMEGFGVATAAAGLPFAELRTISNPIGPRDRAAWRLKEAFAALSTASAALWTACG